MLYLSTDTSQATLDLLEAKRYVDAIESRCNLPVANGRKQPTATFLQQVALWLESVGLPEVTLTGAWQCWKLIFQQVDSLRKANEQNAEIAYWFKIDPFRLSDEQKAALLANLDRVQAQDVLHSGNYQPTDYEFVYNITLLATGDEKLAIKARGRAMAAYVDSKVKK